MVLLVLAVAVPLLLLRSSDTSAHYYEMMGTCRMVCDPYTPKPGGATAMEDLGARRENQDHRVQEGPPGERGDGKVTFPELTGAAGGEKGETEGMNSTGNSFRIAFYVGLKNPHEGYEVLKFDDVITNLGNHYDASTGKFTCHVSGIYFSSPTMC
ncbi:Complement C1q-like protein 2 C1q and tumor necrosis factor-related protein 10 [Larimichthys crocea]|uniref:Complement C1q-like protein 2 C1q and tumor necrosis factor-related protein 10 n=1 Tax=Larimichthys crocea TaxID=215358 RepID=A0A6G0HI29_LARCR|nr:Complement C1q-like protein 2 C1q and tumor necrosis factor-related protein 10 [Larimichthys crocea]